MTFRTEEILDGGLFFEIYKNGGWLTNIAEIAENKGETKLLSDIFFSARVEKIGGHLSVSGGLSFDLRSPCSRCLKPAQKSIAGQIGFSRPLARKENMIDISEDMREQVAMAIPQRLVCDDKCKGLCTGCGTDLNENNCLCETEKDNSRFKVLRESGLSAS